METQTPSPAVTEKTQSATGDFETGATVIYGLLGKCMVTAIETRNVGSETLKLYKLEVQKPAASRSTRQDPAIWVPVQTARERGLRVPMSATDIESAMRVLSNREYYFPLNEAWSTVHPKLESAIRNEGGLGIAKVISFLFVLKKKQVVPTPEVTKMWDQVMKVFSREICEVTAKQPRVLEEEMNKMLRHKLIPDH